MPSATKQTALHSRKHIPQDKRPALVAAALRLFREQGLGATTLAHVATRSKVPIGNVYYYFKTKETLAEAVIASHVDALHALFAALEEKHREPIDRLRALVLAPLGDAKDVVQFGCPHGSLCQELEKLGEGAPLADAGVQLLAAYVEWAKKQFASLGYTNTEAK